MDIEFLFHRMKSSGDEGWCRLHYNENVLNITELCTLKNGKNFKCYVYFATIKNKKNKRIKVKITFPTLLTII